MKAFTLEEYQQFHLNPDRLQSCYQNKWFKLFVPKSYGGLELSMAEGCQRLLEVAEIQGGLGWTVNLGAGANWFSASFADQVAQELFSAEDAVIAGSGASSGQWRELDDAVEISGEWGKCTGAHHATLFSLNATHSGKGLKSFVVPRAKVQLSEDKWPIMGMRNSSSFGIHLEAVKVPKSYGFEINRIKNNDHYGVFHIPFQSFARLSMSASYLGCVKCVLRLCLQGLEKPEAVSLIDKELLPLVETCEQRLYSLASDVEAKSVKGLYLEQHEQHLRSVLGEQNLQVFQSIQTLFLAGGLAFIEEDKLIHWAYRDLLTAVQHFMVKP
ncbi:hypothetical protein H2508_04995 [Parahaliea sp. F7430]|uniref:Acyl-CoA dehydrogenase n=1 Tax=Sediminihaliea albiluteola TaxID=2758564 RepID=A0A7W2YIG3_9GAMM|nr:hypothetical protein [Sediminihaliea albiluteola]MBA6412461.1 hypothetical protein [Sediminihaliea albiluteola]